MKLLANSTLNMRIFVLAGVLFIVVITLGRLVFFAEVKQDSNISVSKDFVFPSEIYLPDWKFIQSDSIDIKNISREGKDNFIAGRNYQYQKGNHQLNAEVIYNIETNGKVVNFLGNYTDVPQNVVHLPGTVEKFQGSAGHYLLFVDSEQAHLVSCINPRGKSTITLSQFNRNRYIYDLTPDRILSWLFQAESIRDLRCLWTNMSIPLNHDKPIQVFPVLEEAWFDWYSWWQAHFPEP